MFQKKQTCNPLKFMTFVILPLYHVFGYAESKSNGHQAPSPMVLPEKSKMAVIQISFYWKNIVVTNRNP